VTAAKPRTRSARSGRALVARVVVAVLLVGVIGTAALAAVAYLTARPVENQVISEFTAGQAQLEAGKTLLQKATKDHSQAELDNARDDFLSARTHFNRGPEIVAQNPFLQAASVIGIPYVATRLRAARSLALMGSSLASAALIGVDVDALLIHPQAGSGSSGPFAVLSQMGQKVPEIRQDLANAQQAAQAVDASLLSSSQASSLKKAVSSINKALTSVDQLGSILPVLLEILGGNGPRGYLVEQASNPELRAGGGFIGSYSIVTANSGQIKIWKSGSVDYWIYPRPVRGQPGYVEPPGPLLDFVANKSWDLADSNYFPDFKTSAHWAEVFAQSQRHVKLDGVISIDPDFVAALLNVTGPMTVPGYNVTVSSANFTSWLFQQQFALKNVTPTKKYVFAVIAAKLMGTLTSLPPSQWPALMTQLNNMASERHLQVYFNDGPAEAIMNQYGWSGAMNPRQSTEYLYEVESNFAASKVNHFVSRTYAVNLSLVNGKLHHVITVTIKNSEPPWYEGGNIYDCFLRLYIPSAATGMNVPTLRQKHFVDQTVPSGYREFQGWAYIPVGSSTGYGLQVLQFVYDTPWSPTAGTQTIYWQKQPGTASDRIAITWTSTGGRYSATGSLTSDQVIELTASGVTLASGQAGTATIPSLSL
jgi:hypothetical protein